MKTTIIRLLSLVAACFAIPVFAQTSATEYSLDIERQPLSTALTELSKQTGLQIGYFPETLTESIFIGPLSGRYTADAAIAQLLLPSGLWFERLNERTIAVTRPVSTKAQPRSRSTLDRTTDDRAAPSFIRLANVRLAEVDQPIMVAERKGSRSDLEEVIVTARKRGERLQDVPVSISAITSEDVERRGLAAMQDYLRSVPGVNQVDFGATNNSIIIRGIAVETGNFLGENFGAGSTVANYFGETPITGSSGAYGGTIDIRPVDLERIEILRGPQGTTFGDGSMGGALRLIPAQAQLDGFGAKVTATYSNTSGTGGDNSMIQEIVNIPVVKDRLALRAVGYRYEDSGYYRNLVGTDSAALARADSWNVRSDVEGFIQDDVGQTVSEGGRISALWRPTDKLNLSMIFLKQKTEQDGVLGATPIYTSVPYSQIVYPIAPQARGRGQRAALQDTDIELSNLTVNYDLGWATLTSTASYLDGESLQIADQSITFAQPSSNINTPDFNSTTAEIRLVSKLSGRFQYLGGVFYQDLDSNSLQTGYSPGPPAPNRYQTNPEWIFTLKRQIDQRAVFGEISYQLTKSLTATVGGRYFEFDRDEQQFREGGLYGTSFGAPITALLSASDSNHTLKANLSYKPTEDSLIYASWSQGFRLGRPQGGLVPFASACDTNNDGLVDSTGLSIASTSLVKSDSLDSYEVGGKFVFGRRVTVDAALYHIDWTDMPFTVAQECAPLFVGNAARTYLANAGSARSEGAEFQIRAYVMDGLRVDFGGSFTLARIEEAPSVAEGSRLPGAPEVNANLGLQYEFSLIGRSAFARADSFYVGPFYSFIGSEESVKAGGYVRVDARTGMNFGNLSAEIFVSNLTDHDVPTYAIYPTIVYMPRPRTIGLQLGYDF